MEKFQPEKGTHRTAPAAPPPATAPTADFVLPDLTCHIDPAQSSENNFQTPRCFTLDSWSPGDAAVLPDEH